MSAPTPSAPAFSLDDLLAAHTRAIAAKDAEIAAWKLEVAAQTQFSAEMQRLMGKAVTRSSERAAQDRTTIENLEYALSQAQHKVADVRRQLQDAQGFGRPYVLHDSPTVVLKFTMAQEDWRGVNPDGSPRNPDGPQKIPTVKLMRKLTGYGLKEAKDLVEGTTELRTHAGWLNEAAIGGFTVQWWLNQLAEGKAKVFHGVSQVTLPAVQFTLTVTEGKRDAQA
tara:strand:- start:1404 stop:2075 length:672 start_codon:yes stop_codon:yes gene_type:complete